MTLCFYLAGWMAATGYQLADDEPRLYDLIVCPLLWPAVFAVQLVLFAVKLDQKKSIA